MSTTQKGPLIARTRKSLISNATKMSRSQGAHSMSTRKGVGSADTLCGDALSRVEGINSLHARGVRSVLTPSGSNVIGLAEWRRRVAQPAPPITHRSDKKALIQALLNDIAYNLGVDLSVPEKPR